MLVSELQHQSLSTKSGIYFFLNERGKILYIGKAKNLRKRVSSYFLKNANFTSKTGILVSQIAKIKTIAVSSEMEAFLLEANYIKKYKPKYNVKLTDDKAYPMIKISVKDKYPKVLIARRKEDNPAAERSIYFGPYPNSAKVLKTVLKVIRKIFPYQSVPNHAKRICLLYHLELCPCPPVFDSEELRREYGKNIKHTINFLNGNTKKIIKDLKKERDISSKNEQFEKASVLQNKINAIKLVTEPYYKKDINDLTAFLNKNSIKVRSLQRIECFDISNIQGTYATGSMVVFVNGERDSSKYRKFKIKTLNTPNDFAMMEEVLKRRFKHKEWTYPNLIIVDGGKGQVSSALKILAMKQFNNSPRGEAGLTIPVIGLAKKEETIVTSDFKEINLPKNAGGLKLIMRIRDEAHRFAITYHRLLRSKNILN